ncbi:transporter substrate-binding domain-containing protein [Stenotrophomonas sp. Iso1]|uniref:transporter substrate-binding domain-containing protein n=1 Tax=Stenotrophomonas sp. Iso1 TaxID=2977283 RepID=UPI0022B793D4|nr:transporter substrate-binding domain-containing protein [Stenotrophomonas sp. Iso1]
MQPILSADEWHWVRGKRALVIGTSSPSFAPMEMINADTYYEGVTADVLGAIGSMLSLDVRVVQFPSRKAALEALEDGRVDVVGSANNYELSLHTIELTQSYVRDEPVLYVRKGEARPLPPRLNGMRLAMAKDYLPLEPLKTMFPGATFDTYESREAALSALAFSKADMYLGDAVSSNYLINLSYFNYVKIHQVLDLPTGGFAFAVRRDSGQLRTVLDAALTAARGGHSNEILKRWSGGGAIASSERVELNAAEQRWLARNPSVRFAVSNDTAPLSYFDSDGRFSGISADLLKAISARTGLEFKQVREPHIGEQIGALERGSADVTILMPTHAREEAFRFSRPFVQTAFAIITRDTPGEPDGVIALRGKRIALPVGHVLRELLQPAWAYRFIESESVTESLQMVADGEADATMALLPIAQYYTAAQHQGVLKVSGVVEDMPTGLSFATRKGDAELGSILEKALLQIPPDEVDIFQNRWRPKSDVSKTAWFDYRNLIYKVGGLAFLLILVSLLWNLKIRSQYKRRQQAADARSEQLNFMESLINGTPHPIYVRDCEGRLVTCNSNYLEVFSATRGAVVGKNALEGVKLDREEAQQFHEDYLWVIENGKPLEKDRTLHLPGRILSVYHWIHPYFDKRGKLEGVICGWIDVSDRRELMEDLRTALDAADQSSRAKTTFLATMSHEIRTPMSAVIGMLELAMLHAEQGRFDKQAIEVAHDSARGLLELIGDILDVVRIESGHASLSPRRANLREVVESVVRVFDGLARQKALTLSLQMDAAVNCDVLVDPLRFKQVLSNLVGNAIKFTDSGEVKIIIGGKPLANERLLVVLSVEDSGIGIAEDELEGLFEPFAQANHGRMSRGGTGLGLPICKSLCELMGGHISVGSVRGVGTRVTLEIPFNRLSEVQDVPHVQEEALGTGHPTMRILVIDDQQANRVLLTQQLGLFGQVVFSAENGEQGLQLWRDQPVDVIITDCNMPVMNGYEMARAIRQEEERDGLAPCAIIGFTANAQPDEKAKCLQAGMDDCLFKPVNLKELSRLLMSLGGMPQVVRAVPLEAAESTIVRILRELTGGDAAMGRMLLDEAHQDYIDDLAALGIQRQRLDARALSRLAHRIKGGARILQAQSIVDACSQLERLCDASVLDRVAITAAVMLAERELELLIGEVAAFRESSSAPA